MDVKLFKKDNDNILKLVGMTDNENDTYLNNITGVQATIKDYDGHNVSGVSWPVSVNYVIGSDGNYIAVLPYTAVVTLSQQYIVNITGNAGVGKIFDVNLRALCVENEGP